MWLVVVRFPAVPRFRCTALCVPHCGTDYNASSDAGCMARTSWAHILYLGICLGFLRSHGLLLQRWLSPDHKEFHQLDLVMVAKRR